LVSCADFQTQPLVKSSWPIMGSNADPLSIATEKTILPPVFGKETQFISEKRDSSSEEAVVVNGGEDIIKESDYTDEDYKKLLKKVDRFLLPLMWFCYGVQQTDKTSLGTQAIFGMRDDTNLVGQQYSWLTTIFYLAYLIGEFPSNFLLQRWSLGKSLSIYMLLWGVCVFCVGAAQEWSHLMAVRALQGFFECTISPGFVLVVGSWYRTDEHSSRSLFWQSANAGFGILASLVSARVYTGYYLSYFGVRNGRCFGRSCVLWKHGELTRWQIMYGIGTHAQKNPDSLAPWRAISMFLGSCTVVLALICFALLGSPQEVFWLSKDEKRMAAARILRNKAGRDVTGKKWKWPQVTEAFKDPQLYFAMVNAFLSSVPNG